MPFDRAFSQISAEDFVQRFLSRRSTSPASSSAPISISATSAGARRSSSAQAGVANGFAVETLDLIEDGTAPISSSRIREALRTGDLDHANELLGYHWFIDGEVVVGDHRGRDLGYPTANLATPPIFDLAQGVYAVRGKLGDRLLDGVASYGKPMFDNTRPPFETFFFDFDEDIYGQDLSVALIAHIRGQEVFSGLDELIAAMNRDSAEGPRSAGAAQSRSASSTGSSASSLARLRSLPRCAQEAATAPSAVRAQPLSQRRDVSRRASNPTPMAHLAKRPANPS